MALGRTPGAIRAALHRGRFPLRPRRILGRVYFDHADVVRLLASNTFKDAEPPTALTLADAYLAIASDLEASIDDAGRLKDSPAVVLAVHTLVQAVAGIVWAIGLAKSSDFWEMTRAWFSHQGWNRYHAAQLEAVEERRANHAK